MYSSDVRVLHYLLCVQVKGAGKPHPLPGQCRYAVIWQPGAAETHHPATDDGHTHHTHTHTMWRGMYIHTHVLPSSSLPYSPYYACVIEATATCFPILKDDSLSAGGSLLCLLRLSSNPSFAVSLSRFRRDDDPLARPPVAPHQKHVQLPGPAQVR